MSTPMTEERNAPQGFRVSPKRFEVLENRVAALEARFTSDPTDRVVRAVGNAIRRSLLATRL